MIQRAFLLMFCFVQIGICGPAYNYKHWSLLKTPEIVALFQAPEKCFRFLVQAPWTRLNPEIAKYQTSPMSSLYFLFDIIWSEYFSEAELAKMEIEYNTNLKQWQFLADGEPLEEGEYTVAMDAWGHIYVHNVNDEAPVHHSSYFRGGRVASAGHLFINSRSAIVQFSAMTGHYFRGFKQPSANWRNFLTELNDRHVDITTILVHEILPGWGAFSNANKTRSFRVKNL